MKKMVKNQEESCQVRETFHMLSATKTKIVTPHEFAWKPSA